MKIVLTMYNIHNNLKTDVVAEHIQLATKAQHVTSKQHKKMMCNV